MSWLSGPTTAVLRKADKGEIAKRERKGKKIERKEQRESEKRDGDERDKTEERERERQRK